MLGGKRSYGCFMQLEVSTSLRFTWVWAIDVEEARYCPTS